MLHTSLLKNEYFLHVFYSWAVFCSCGHRTSDKWTVNCSALYFYILHSAHMEENTVHVNHKTLNTLIHCGQFVMSTEAISDTFILNCFILLHESCVILVLYLIFQFHPALAMIHFQPISPFSFFFSNSFISGMKESKATVEQACSRNGDFNNGPICSLISGSANPQHNQAVTDGSSTADNSAGIVCIRV